MKSIIIGLFLVLNLHAISYEELLELAIKNNTALEIAKSQEEQLLLEGDIEIRLENPTLELGLADFSNKRIFQNHDFGGAVGISQSILLPSVKNARKRVNSSRVNVAKEKYNLQKSEFIYGFAMKYLAYKEAVELESTAEAALSISSKIVHIAKERYQQGTGFKSNYLQAKIDHKNLQNSQKYLSFKAIKVSNELQRLANIHALSSLEKEHTFTQTNVTALHPLVSLTQEKKKLAEAKLQVASHTMESIEVFSELEREPTEDIFRVGVKISLILFNDKSQEKQLAKIERINHQLALKGQKKSLTIELRQLENETLLLKNMLLEYEVLIEKQHALLDIYEKGYGIAKINLLEVQMSKKSLITNQENIIKTKVAIERNIVKMNYLKGKRYE